MVSGASGSESNRGCRPPAAWLILAVESRRLIMRLSSHLRETIDIMQRCTWQWLEGYDKVCIRVVKVEQRLDNRHSRNRG